MRYRVYLMEVIGSYAQDEWTEDYATAEDAEERIRNVNSEPILGAEWYMQAKTKYEVIE